MSDREIELVASLADNAAFVLLLEQIEAEIDTYEDLLARAGSQFAQNRLLAQWAVLKKLYRILRYTPQHFKNAAEELRETQPENPMGELNPQKFLTAMQWGLLQAQSSDEAAVE